jgi:Nif-specific regulatory protein
VKARLERIKSLTETLSAFLEREQNATRTLVSSLLKSLKTIQDGTADRRFVRVIDDLKEFQKQSDSLIEMSRQNFLAKIQHETGELEAKLADSRIAAILAALVHAQPIALNAFCEKLLDCLIEATGAGRGFLIFYLPESTEAEVVSARNFRTDNLALEEYEFSRTLLREALRRSEPLLVIDASQHPTYSKQMSVVAYELKSVLVVPMRHHQKTIGAIYLDNKALPCAFDEEDRSVVECIARFASFYIHHARLLPVALERRKGVFLDESKASTEILGRDPKMLQLVGTIRQIADSNASVLIEGESGTGKELVARALHTQSAQCKQRFVAINCPAIPEELFESELFGHEKGAYTDAIRQFAGRIQDADGGTLFLDEVNELAYPMQAKLLRFLESQEFQRLGSNETIKVNVRVVAATSSDLKKLVEAGRFQEALYYRLIVIPLTVPTLRERKGDIQLLAEHFLAKFCSDSKKELGVEPGFYDLLKEYPFPGNVRELKHLIQRLVAFAQGDSIGIGDLPRDILQLCSHRIDLDQDPLYRIFPFPPSSLQEVQRREKALLLACKEQKRRLAEHAVQAAKGNKTEAAAKLGVSRVTLYEMLGTKAENDDEGGKDRDERSGNHTLG